ncbi:MAG: beta-propeller fold lactonase family protein [Phycisphaera sp.]|nr:beta-propeller fold lactonase family protein [Phycisphaera sp.]
MHYMGYAVAGVMLAVAMLGVAPPPANGATQRVYIGTYTGKESKGIYVCELDLDTGKLSEPRLAAEVTNPSFVAISPDRKHVYAVNEVSNFDGKPLGAVTAFAIDASTGGLTQLNQRSSGGAGPCYVIAAGGNAYVANYGGGSVACLPINADGSLGEGGSVIQHEGSSVHNGHPTPPHAHSINVDAAGRFAIAADAGIDKLFVYRIGAEAKLTPNDPPFTAAAVGAGPRHFAFHPSGKFAYVINETNRTVTAYAYDANAGTLTELQTLTTVPADVTKGSTAEVRVHPSGRFLYGSNRGHDSIAVYAIDPATGRLTAKGQVPTGGKTPRNFGVDPTGRYLLAANQDSASVVVFRIDPDTGMPTPTGQSIHVDKPVCVKFLQLD